MNIDVILYIFTEIKDEHNLIFNNYSTIYINYIFTLLKTLKAVPFTKGTSLNNISRLSNASFISSSSFYIIANLNKELHATLFN